MIRNISKAQGLYMCTELKTLEWDILNHGRLIWVPMYTLLIFFLILFFGYPYCIKVTLDKYIDWTNIRLN